MEQQKKHDVALMKYSAISPRAGGAASPRKKKRGPANREGRGPAVAARPRLIRRPRTSPRPNLETKCPKARTERPPR